MTTIDKCHFCGKEIDLDNDKYQYDNINDFYACKECEDKESFTQCERCGDWSIGSNFESGYEGKVFYDNLCPNCRKELE
jgi:hypothetical protein